jgi:hypothetical protein
MGRNALGQSEQAVVHAVRLRLVLRADLRRHDGGDLCPSSQEAGIGKLSSVLIIAVPFFYLWDLFVEGVSVGLGYWTYFDTFGPSITFASTAISLVHPLIIFTIYGVVAAYILSDRDENGHARFESIFRVKSVRTGWRRESVRLIAYVVVMNLTFFIFMSVPMIAVRELFGHANTFVP